MEGLTAKSMAELLGQRSLACTALAGWTGKHKHRAFPSRQQSLLAAMLPNYQCATTLAILAQFKSSRVNKVLMLCRYRAATRQFCFLCEMNFRWNWQEVVADQSHAHRFAQSFDHASVSE